MTDNTALREISETVRQTKQINYTINVSQLFLDGLFDGASNNKQRSVYASGHRHYCHTLSKIDL